MVKEATKGTAAQEKEEVPPSPSAADANDASAADADADADPQQELKTDPPPKKQRPPVLYRLRHHRLMWPLVLCLPYIVGVVWHVVLHPVASVLTGDLQQPRRLYVDENSADPHHFRINHMKYNSRQRQLEQAFLLASKSSSSSSSTSATGQRGKQQQQQPLSSLCRAVETLTTQAGIPFDYNYKNNDGVSSLPSSSSSSSCHSMGHDDAMHVLQILPTVGPITIRSEAIVLVLPASENWASSPLHGAFLSFLYELLLLSTSNEQQSWLAKTILVVAPAARPSGQTLTTRQTVDKFLDAYLGREQQSSASLSQHYYSNHQNPTMPKGITSSALLRQLIVWDQEYAVADDSGDDDATTTKTITTPTIRVLPQGPRGLLPNMDLVSVVRVALQRSSVVASNTATAEIHPYQHRHENYKNRIHALLDKTVCQWLASCPPTWKNHVESLLNFFLFQHALRGHDFVAPHGTALERGIDALTIQFVIPGASLNNSHKVKIRSVASKLPMAMEIMVRAMSNLHERLHHSTSLYLLLDIDHFVKHEEYLVPNILLLIPLIIRAVTLVLVDLVAATSSWSDWSAVGEIVEFTLLSTIGVAVGVTTIQWVDESFWWSFTDSTLASHAIVGILYLILLGRAVMFSTTGNRNHAAADTETARWSVQLVLCLLSLYIHVGIAFGHVSLAFPSAFFWTPLLAFPSYGAQQQESTTPQSSGSMNPLAKAWYGISRIGSLLLGPALLLATLPFVWLVPSILPSYTPYVCYAYLPLHLLASHLWLS